MLHAYGAQSPPRAPRRRVSGHELRRPPRGQSSRRGRWAPVHRECDLHDRRRSGQHQPDQSGSRPSHRRHGQSGDPEAVRKEPRAARHSDKYVENPIFTQDPKLPKELHFTSADNASSCSSMITACRGTTRIPEWADWVLLSVTMPPPVPPCSPSLARSPAAMSWTTSRRPPGRAADAERLDSDCGELALHPDTVCAGGHRYRGRSLAAGGSWVIDQGGEHQVFLPTTSPMNSSGWWKTNDWPGPQQSPLVAMFIRLHDVARIAMVPAWGRSRFARRRPTWRHAATRSQAAPRPALPTSPRRRPAGSSRSFLRHLVFDADPCGHQVGARPCRGGWPESHST